MVLPKVVRSPLYNEAEALKAQENGTRRFRSTGRRSLHSMTRENEGTCRRSGNNA